MSYGMWVLRSECGFSGRALNHLSGSLGLILDGVESMGLDKFMVACIQHQIKQFHPKYPLGPSNSGFSWVVSSCLTQTFVLVEWAELVT